MSDPISTEVPVTITLDLDAFASHIIRKNTYYGDDAEPEFAFDPIMAEVVRRVQATVEQAVVKEAVKRLDAAIDAEVGTIVRAAFDGEFQPTTPYGSADGPKTNLRERIVKQANEWFGAPNRNGGYGDRESNGQKFIKAEVERVVLADCKAALESNRAAIVAKIKDIASTLLASEAVKR
jgi:hypothetical protein